MKYESFSPLCAQHQADPYRVFEDLAQRGPLHRTRSGLWLVSGHALSTDILRNPIFKTEYSTALARTYGSDFRKHPSLRFLSHSFVLSPDKAGGEVRKLFARMFSQGRLQAHACEMRELASRLVDETLRASSVDILHGFAAPFTLQALGRLLAIPMRLLEGIPPMSNGLVTALDCARLSTAELSELDARTAAACEEFLPFLQSEEARESECVAGLLKIASAHDLSMESVFSDLLFIFLAGFETTSSLIAQVAWYLAQDPAVADAIANDPASIGPAVEEFARLFPSIHIVTRRPSANVEIAGTMVRPTETVLVLVAAANRDPLAFPQPREFLLARQKLPVSLAFGAGVHYCVGATLARHELNIALDTMTRHPQLRRVAAPAWRRLGVFRSLELLPQAHPVANNYASGKS